MWGGLARGECARHLQRRHGSSTRRYRTSATPIAISEMDQAPYATGVRAFTPPKTRSGEDRVVELDSRTLGALLEHRLRQDAERGQWGSAYLEGDLVFAREGGGQLSPEYVTKAAADQVARSAPWCGVAAARIGRGIRRGVEDAGSLVDRDHRRHLQPSAAWGGAPGG
jgi:hypothetical protein